MYRTKFIKEQSLEFIEIWSFTLIYAYLRVKFLYELS